MPTPSIKGAVSPATLPTSRPSNFESHIINILSRLTGPTAPTKNPTEVTFFFSYNLTFSNEDNGAVLLVRPQEKQKLQTTHPSMKHQT